MSLTALPANVTLEAEAVPVYDPVEPQVVRDSKPLPGVRRQSCSGGYRVYRQGRDYNYELCRVVLVRKKGRDPEVHVRVRNREKPVIMRWTTANVEDNRIFNWVKAQIRANKIK